MGIQVTRTSREPTLAFEIMFMLIEIVAFLLKVLVVGFFLLLCLRLMAWADTGSRGECPIERNFLPD
jgi:hypothetical protein